MIRSKHRLLYQKCRTRFSKNSLNSTLAKDQDPMSLLLKRPTLPMPQVSSHLSQVRTSLRLLTRELRTAGSTDDFSYLSNDVGNVSIALANGETLPIQGTGTVSLPPLSCGQVMGSTADRDTDTVLDCDKWELLMSSIPAPRRTTERGGLGIVTSRPALCRFSYHIQSKGLRHSIETFEGVSPGAALEPTSPLHPGKSYHTAH